MSDQDDDDAGIWRDPNGIVTIGPAADNRVRVGHRVIIVCDSHRSLMARLTGYQPPSGTARARGICPECGKDADVIVVDADGRER